MSFDIAFDDADLNGFVDGRIEPARAALLADHLASDQEARARIDIWKRQNESLRTMFASVLFESVPVRLSPPAVPAPTPPMVAGGRGDAKPGHSPTAGPLVMTAVGMALIGFAVGALTSLGTGDFGLASPASRPADVRSVVVTSDVAQRAGEAHRTYLDDPVRPVELTAADAPKLSRWIHSRLGAALHVPDLQHLGWAFNGGRIVPGRSGPAAFLVYANGADRLGLYVTRADDGDAKVAETSNRPDLSLIGVVDWTADGFGYALTSDRGSAWLDRNVAPLRGSVMSQIRGDKAAP